MTYVGSYILNNKKRNIFSILSIILSTVLLISVGIIFSSLRDFLISEVKEEIGDYHVILKGDISNYDFILNKKYKDKRYFITYKNIYKVYENTNEICESDSCENITYNDSLLSLYGISKNENILNTLKKIIYFLVSILSIIIFFIIYNSFKAGLNIRKKDVSLFKLIGMNNSDLYKLFFKESIVISFIGFVLGFILSIFINFIFIKVINDFLYEIFKGKLFLKVYFPFIFIPILFMFIIIILSALLPLKDIRKYNAMELFRKKDNINNINIPFFNNFILWLTNVNYKRSKDKYKSLIICIFILVLSINIFSLVLKYGLKCIDRYVIIPEYDLRISLNNKDELLKIAKDLKTKKMVLYKSCEMEIHIPKKYFLKDYKDKIKAIITDSGGNNVINKANKITTINNKISHVKYLRFKNLSEVIFEDNIKINNLSLTNKVPFGLKEIDNVVINLNKEEFNNVCPEYTNNLYLKTNYKGLDRYLDNLIKKNKYDMVYINVKKSKEIISNLIIIIKLFLYGILVLIFLVMILSVVNTIWVSIGYRSRELATFNSIGLESNKVNFSLFLESLIVSFKGWFCTVPLIFVANKYLYSGIKKVFDFKKIILNIDVMFLSLFLSVISVFVVMLISYKKIRKRSLISNIKIDF